MNAGRAEGRRPRTQPRERRREFFMPLLTIVFTDVVGSSATKRDVSLGRDDRERDHAYLEQVQTRHFSLIRACCRSHSGREVSNMGDAFYLAFDDPVEAVRCAASIQKQLAAEPIATPRGPLRLRMGIHSGFPEFFEGSWHGTDVDLAARVEAEATQQQILISARTYELVRHMTDVEFHPCGEFALKGMDKMSLWEADWDGKGPRPTAEPPLGSQRRRKQTRIVLAALAAAIVVAAAAYGYHRYFAGRAREMAGTSATVTPRRAVAVLGFKNLGGPDADWLSTALSEMFSTELAAGEQVRTIPGENVARARIELSLPEAESYAPDTLARLRKVLSADDVIVGSYLALNSKGDAKIRLDLRAQDTVACNTVCSVSETGVEGDLFDLVTRAGKDVRQHLGMGGVTEKQDATVKVSFPSDPEAARLYAEGLKDLRIFDALEARRSLEKAVAISPDFALGHAALAQALSQLGYKQKSKIEAKKAVDSSAGLSREDQLSIEGRYEAAINDWTKGIETYSSLWNFFPDNLEYGLLLAGTQQRSGKNQESLATIERLRKLPALESDDPRLDLAESDAAAGLSDFQREIAAAEHATSKAQANGARLIAARGFIVEGRTFQDLGDLEKSIAAYEQGRQIAVAAGDRGQEAQALLGSSVVVEEQGDFARAQKMCKESLAIWGDLGNENGTARALNELAIMLRHQGNPEGAMKMFEKTLEVNRKVDDKYAQALSLGNIGNVLRDEGDLAGANGKYEETLPLFHETGNRQGEAITLGNIGNNLNQMGDLAGANQSLNQAIEVARAINDKGVLTFILLTSGDTLYLGGDLAQGKARCSEALESSKAISYKQYSAEAYSCLGNILQSQGDLEGARQMEKQALAIHADLGEKGEMAESQIDLASILAEQGHPADALAPIREARDEYRKENKVEYEFTATTALADALLEAGRPDEARKETDAAHGLLSKCEDRNQRLEFTIVAARARAASASLSDRAEARKSIEATLAEATRAGFVGTEFDAILTLGKMEIDSGEQPAGRARLAALEKNASAKGYGLIARKAAAALN
jgi:class 3 adenylate cyclase/tetratricopeptide (TPR) repeat protein